MKKMTYLKFSFVVLFAIPLIGQAETVLNENCTISILNRTIQVSPDGGWSMPNVPSTMGRIRARATCLVDGETISGESEYFSVENNGLTEVSEILFDDIHPDRGGG